MSGDINLLILDEPTNHLDLQSRTWIEDAVGGYGETLIFTSHDRYFINKFATRVWELDDGAFTDFEGTYAEWRGMRGGTPQTRMKYEEIRNRVQRSGFGGQGSGGKGVGAGIVSVRRGQDPDVSGRQGGNIQTNEDSNKRPKRKMKPSDALKEQRRLERAIEKAEGELGDIRRQKEEFATDYEKLMVLDEMERSAQASLDGLYVEWERSLSACEGLR
jgi:ABC-type multidrug transport system ATPase subunit